MNFHIQETGRTYRQRLFALSALLLALGSTNAIAQSENDADEELVDEITVTGTQIKGARISDALAVSVFSSEDIEILGIESGEELLDSIPEMGQNFFNESDTAGSVNAARGDVGAINLRNLGTGNTLTLLNGRRLVNMATYQTEEVGGSFVPVNSVNSRHIPVFGLERVEILRDGASAIYGADAVAGVVNTVLKDDYEGFTVRLRYSDYDQIPRNDESLAIEWGDSFNGGATHVGVFARHYRRDRINAQDDPRWSNSDFRGRFPEGSPFAFGGVDGIEDDDDDDSFDNTSGNSLYGRFDVVPNIGNSHSLNTQDIVQPGAEDFELFPVGHPDCAGTFFILPSGVCMREDSADRGFRHNLNGGRDLMSELERTMVYGYINHELNESLEAFGEAYFYDSSTNKVNSAVTDLGSVVLRVGASNYYNPLGSVNSAYRLPDPDGLIYEDVPDEGYDLYHDLYRFEEAPRTVDNDGQSTRLLFGLRGTASDWDWESAAVWSEATRDDFTRNRISNTLITQAFYDPTPAAYNAFSGGVDSNIERALVGMYRKGRSTLSMWDLKFSNPEIFQMPAGPVGFLAGYEYRRETYDDDRDPRLDGTIRFMRESDPVNAPGVFDIEGDFNSCDPDTTELGCSDTGFDTYPLTSDIVGASPTPDGSGSRTTNSLFVEFQVPLHETLDLQLAARYEDFDDIGDTTVGKIAFGWRPVDQLLFRGSWSEAFRAPNLITINEQFVARANTRDDWLCQYAEAQTTADDTSFCSDSYSMQRQATGSKDLVPEESTNTSIGVVITPVEGLSVTLDFWTIEKDSTIGLFGEENHILNDLVLRLDNPLPRDDYDTDDPDDIAEIQDFCANVTGNPLVSRIETDYTDSDLIPGYVQAGLCPAENVVFVSDNYQNLERREVRGYDIGIYYDFDTSIGEFSLRYNGSFYEKYLQVATSEAALSILEAKENNPDIAYPLIGLGNLLGVEGFQESRHSASAIWRKDDWRVGLTGYRISGFDENATDAGVWKIPSMTTYNATIDYNFDVGDVASRVRLGINNFTDERAPIADEPFGFFDDAHRDWGAYYYLDLKVSF